jgi:SagB-type dehydrogenase family enzyme
VRELPAASFIDAISTSPATGGPIDLGTLSELLRRSGGLRGGVAGGRVDRWAPTGGNLGSVQLYLIVTDCPGIGEGGYFYQPFEAVLARLHLTSPAAKLIKEAAGWDDADDSGYDALIVLTAALGRVAHKYMDFAYRVVALDSGVAQAQLKATSRALGVQARSLARWDDARLADELQIDPGFEPVTGVVGLRGRR